MTATIRQAEANQKNSEKSTGPKTDVGKAASSRNSATHGMTGLQPSAGEQAEFETRLEAWRRDTVYGGIVAGQPDRELLFQQMVLQTLRMERARDREFELIDAGKAQARTRWEEDRVLEAQTIGKTLAKQPGLAVAKLRCFLQGVEWLIEQWEFLLDTVKENGRANPEQVGLMYDLLGRRADLRPEFLDGLGLDEIVPIIEEHLDDLKTASMPRLIPMNDYDRELAQAGFRSETSREERLNRRYESLALKRFETTRKALLELASEPVAVPVAPPLPTQTATSASIPQPAAAIKPSPEAAASKTNVQSPPSKTNDRPGEYVSPTVSAAPVAPLRNEPIFTTGKMGPTVTPKPQQRSA